MKQIPRISESEWELMKVLWRQAPLSSQQIMDELGSLQGQDQWHPNTVKTLLARLVKKGALRYITRGRAYLYEPQISERECVGDASRSFLERVFGGSLQPLLAHFVENEELTSQEIEELKKLLNKPSRKK